MKRIVLLIVTLLVSMNFYAQLWDNSKPDQNVTFGLRIGPNFSMYSSNNHYYEGQCTLGGQAGVIVDFNFIKSFAFETGVLYTFTNAIKQKYNAKKVSFSGPEIPLLASFKLSIANEKSVQLKSGLSMSYMIEKPETLKVVRPDVAAIIGVGVSLKKLYVGAQYELGITNVAEEIKKNYLAILLGYDF